jgi:hypothetical protein
MKNVLGLAAFAAAFAASSGAHAGITISAVHGNAVYAGPATYDFESAAPVVGGAIRNISTSGLAAQPLGSTGNFWTIGASDGMAGTLDLSGYAAIGAISFIWGSVDNWNWLDVLDRNGSVLKTFNGVDVAMAPNGSWTAQAMNPLATIAITGTDRSNIGALRLRSGTNAFEVDNFAIAAVPEPASWALLLIGFGALGGTMRARTRQSVQARLALRMA